MLKKLIDWQRRAVLLLLAIGMSLVMGGTCLVPVAGCGGAYVFALGLWLLAAAVVLLASFIAWAGVFRWRSGYWHFGEID